jgi:hypothetical protein
MESERVIWILLGGFFVLCAFGLSLIKIDKEELKNSIHTNPSMALFRYSAYRWGAVVVLSIIGIALLSTGLGWLS